MGAAARTGFANKGLLTASVMLATIVQALDATIANVALPHIQSALSATRDQIAWVLTSYIVAAAVMYPLTGWLANAFGRRPVFLASVAGFTLASALCGAAISLPQLVLFRLLQGIAGAALVPLSQAILFDINEPKDYGRAMALWGIGVTLGPILGPALGGFLTDHYSWRWVFYINLPIGLLALAGLSVALPREFGGPSKPFDIFGFATLSLCVAALQLMLDRGQTLDWFSSREIVIEAMAAGIGFYLFIIHSLSSKGPFLNLALFRDRNFVAANIFLFLIGVVLFATLALHPLLMQDSLGYPVTLSGLLIAARGVGGIAGMIVVGRLLSRLDARLVMAVALCLTAWSLEMMTGYSLLMDERPILVAGVISGIGIGGLNVALSTIAFATLPADLRNEGTAFSNLIRSLGGAVGISVTVFLLTQNSQRLHVSMGSRLTPYALRDALSAQGLDWHTAQGLGLLSRWVDAQAAMIAYIDDFRLMAILTVASLPFLLLFREKTA